MPDLPLDSDLALAHQLADTADAISALRFRATDLIVTTKPDMTPVSDADRAVEMAIRGELAASRPEDSILGEEFGAEFGAVGNSRRQWIIDPIDGTANYVRGVPVWATLISLAIDRVPVIGVVSAPALGSRWWAATGGGAWMRDADGERRIRVSAVSKLADASISYNSIQQWDAHGHLDELIALSRQVWRTRAYGDMWSYMMLAEGLLDVAGEYDLQPYDMAALMPIVEEAGGRFTSMDGRPGPWHGSALATNSLLHEAVREAMNNAKRTRE